MSTLLVAALTWLQILVLCPDFSSSSPTLALFSSSVPESSSSLLTHFQVSADGVGPGLDLGRMAQTCWLGLLTMELLLVRIAYERIRELVNHRQKLPVVPHLCCRLTGRMLGPDLCVFEDDFFIILFKDAAFLLPSRQGKAAIPLRFDMRGHEFVQVLVFAG